MNKDNMKFIDPAKAPDKPIKPRLIFNMAIAGVLGLPMLGDADGYQQWIGEMEEY